MIFGCILIHAELLSSWRHRGSSQQPRVWCGTRTQQQPGVCCCSITLFTELTPTPPPQTTAWDSCNPADTLIQPKPNPSMLKTQLQSPGSFLEPKTYRNYWKYCDSKVQLFQQWRPWSAAPMALHSCCGLEPDSSLSSMFHIGVNPSFWNSCPNLCYCKRGQEGLKNDFLGI